MHEAELPVYKIKIQTQAFTPSIDQARSTFSVGKFEALACLYCGKDTYEPLGNAIPFGNFAGFFLFSNLAVEMNVRPCVLFSHGLTVSLDFFRLLGDERFEILQQKTLGGHEPIHVFCPTDSQVSFEEDSIKTGYRSGNFLCMLINKLVHGVLPDGVVAQLPH
jgi:hypothetical protein